MKPQIWGVEHTTEEELQEVLKELEKNNFTTIGLELTQEAIGADVDWGFFGTLYQHLKEKQVNIIALESRELLNEFEAITYACQVYFKHRPKAELEEQLKKDTEMLEKYGETLDPTDKKILLLRTSIYSKAIKILDEQLSPEEMNQKFNYACYKRDLHVAEVIKAKNPDLSIVGSSHLITHKKWFPSHLIRDFSKKE